MKKFIIISIMLLVFTGCTKNQKSSQISTEPTKITKNIDEATTEKQIETKKLLNYQEIKPNEIGDILIIMYHGIVEGKPPSVYQRNVEDFKKDLQYLHDNKYRLITMRDYIDNNINVEAGYSPVILTFDDGISTSFSLIEENGELKPLPNCGVDIINKFAEKYPDFGKTAIFHINGDSDPFKGAGTFKERVKYLIDNGYELGNHKFEHTSFRKIKDAEQIQNQIAQVDILIKISQPDYIVDSLAYPLGERPIDELKPYIANGKYTIEDKTFDYHYAIGLREGQSGVSSAPNNINYDPYNLPRARGSEGEDTDLWWQLKYYKNNPNKKYISDGNPNIIAVPKEYENNINKDSLNEKELYLY